jgi:hypothetical protein
MYIFSKPGNILKLFFYKNCEYVKTTGKITETEKKKERKELLEKPNETSARCRRLGQHINTTPGRSLTF